MGRRFSLRTKHARRDRGVGRLGPTAASRWPPLTIFLTLVREAVVASSNSLTGALVLRMHPLRELRGRLFAQQRTSLNWPARIVVALTLLGVLALLGDLPRSHQDDVSGVPIAEVQIDWRSADFIPLETSADYEVDLPILPGSNATLHGSIWVRGITLRPGEVDVAIVMPAPTGIVLDSVQTTKVVDHVWRTVPAAEQEPGDYSADRSVSVGLLQLRPDVECVEWALRFGFHTSHPTFSRGDGWARQNVSFDLRPRDDYDAGTAERVDAQRQCGFDQGLLTVGPGTVTLDASPQQEISAAEPAPIRVFGEDPQWSVPASLTEQPTTRFVVENTTVRYWVGLAQQLLFVAVGALLGSISIRRRKEDPTGERHPRAGS
jgi:hypothetical protein